MAQYQKRLIQLFKAFVQKTFIPAFKKNDLPLNQWNKFSSMISTDTLNYNDIQFYVDGLPNPNTLQPFDNKRDTLSVFPKRPEENNRQNLNDNQSTNFNANKTFGGQRAKMMMFPLKADYDDFNNQKSNNDYANKDASKEETYKNKLPNNGQSVISALERLYKTFLENQQKIENSAGATNNGQLQHPPDYKNYY